MEKCNKACKMCFNSLNSTLEFNFSEFISAVAKDRWEKNLNALCETNQREEVKSNSLWHNCPVKLLFILCCYFPIIARETLNEMRTIVVVVETSSYQQRFKIFEESRFDVSKNTKHRERVNYKSFTAWRSFRNVEPLNVTIRIVKQITSIAILLVFCTASTRLEQKKLPQSSECQSILSRQNRSDDTAKVLIF